MVQVVPAFGVPTGPEVCGASKLQDLLEVGSGPLVLLLSAFSLLLSSNTYEICPISRFKGVSSVVWAFRVGLCWLGGLR